MIRVDGEKLVKLVKEMTEEELAEAIRDCMYDLCMEALEERDCDLKLTGKCKKCYDYSAEQFILSYIRGKSIKDVMDDIDISGVFYNTWRSFLNVAKCIVEYDGEFHNSFARSIEGIINNSGISRKTWIKFLDYYFSER